MRGTHQEGGIQSPMVETSRVSSVTPGLGTPGLAGVNRKHYESLLRAPCCWLGDLQAVKGLEYSIGGEDDKVSLPAPEASLMHRTLILYAAYMWFHSFQKTVRAGHN